MLNYPECLQNSSPLAVGWACREGFVGGALVDQVWPSKVCFFIMSSFSTHSLSVYAFIVLFSRILKLFFCRSALFHSRMASERLESSFGSEVSSSFSLILQFCDVLSLTNTVRNLLGSRIENSLLQQSSSLLFGLREAASRARRLRATVLCQFDFCQALLVLDLSRSFADASLASPFLRVCCSQLRRRFLVSDLA